MVFVFRKLDKPLKLICLVLATTWLVKRFQRSFKSSKMATSLQNDVSPLLKDPQDDAALQCSFGVMSDVQYADVPDGTNYGRTSRRFYRGGIDHLKKAVREWTAQNVDFAMDLGDTIDGLGRKHGQSESNLNAVLDEYDKLSKPVFFHWGNHEYYNFKKATLLANERFNSILRNRLPVSSEHTGIYHTFSPCPGFRIVVLDTYEISMLGLPKSDPNYVFAKKLLVSMNPNEELNSSSGMPKDAVRFVKFNGGLSQTQLDWLDSILSEADEKRERVLVSGHMPVYQPATDAHCLVWNYDSVLKILQAHPSVTAYFCGHDHKGGQAVDSVGIHHVTFPAVVETHPDSQAFAIVRVAPTEMVIKGYGRVPSETVPFNRTF